MNLLYPDESYTIRGLAFEIYKLFRNNHKEAIYLNTFYLGLKQEGLKVEKENVNEVNKGVKGLDLGQSDKSSMSRRRG